MSGQELKLKGKIVLKKNTIINKIWHPESTLVFKSSKEKLVIGRFHENEFVSLDDEALELCVQWKFKYDTSLVDEEEEVSEGESVSTEEKTKEESEHETDEVSEPEPVKDVKKYEKKPNDLEPEDEIVKEVKKNKEQETVKELDRTLKENIKDGNKNVREAETVQKLEGDVSLQMDLVFSDLEASTQLLRKNFQRILDSVQNTAATRYTALSKELETLRQEHEDTKAKLAKIRNALGL